MARISLVKVGIERVLLQDLEKRQTMREHTINPPGQERYIRHADLDAIQAVLDASAITVGDADSVITATLGAVTPVVSTTAIQSGVTGTLTPDELAAIQDLLSYRILETGNFLLSFDRGTISKMVALGWVKVFTDDCSADFTL